MGFWRDGPGFTELMGDTFTGDWQRLMNRRPT
jgi:hypothetical protein